MSDVIAVLIAATLLLGSFWLTHLGTRRNLELIEDLKKMREPKTIWIDLSEKSKADMEKRIATLEAQMRQHHGCDDLTRRASKEGSG